MDENRIKGEAKQIKGSIKEAIGKITGNQQVEADGAIEKTEGKAQAAVGKAAEYIKDKLNK